MTSSDISSDKLFLALCSAEEELLVVLGTAQRLLGYHTVVCPGQSIQHLHPMIAQLLTTHQLGTKNLAGIACVSGPGSFTGLRIAHACMYGLALPFAIPMAGLAYHALLARQTATDPAAHLWVITYARRGQVYVQSFSCGNELGPITVRSVAETRQCLESGHQPILLGSGIRRNPELQTIAGATVLSQASDILRPETLLQAACEASYRNESPPPIYLRKSDAEDNLPAIAASRGISESEARAEIFDYI